MILHDFLTVFLFVSDSYPHMFNGLPPMRQTDDENDGLGPLPLKWEKAYTENGELYFIE